VEEQIVAQNDAHMEIQWDFDKRRGAELFLNIIVADGDDQGPFFSDIRPNGKPPNHTNEQLSPDHFAGTKQLAAPTGMFFWVGFYYDLDGRRNRASKAFRARNGRLLTFEDGDLKFIGPPDTL
jgi:hypothetical protein